MEGLYLRNYLPPAICVMRAGVLDTEHDEREAWKG
jgi:hypothetical protein